VISFVLVGVCISDFESEVRTSMRVFHLYMGVSFVKCSFLNSQNHSSESINFVSGTIRIPLSLTSIRLAGSDITNVVVHVATVSAL